MSDISLSQLLEEVSILAIKPTDGIPKCSYIYSEVNNIHILDLVQSATLLKEANSYVKSASSEGKTFLFVGTKRKYFDCSRSKTLRFILY
jgi:small subunit ribosomal protein S2